MAFPPCGRVVCVSRLRSFSVSFSLGITTSRRAPSLNCNKRDLPYTRFLSVNHLIGRDWELGDWAGSEFPWAGWATDSQDASAAEGATAGQPDRGAVHWPSNGPTEALDNLIKRIKRTA